MSIDCEAVATKAFTMLCKFCGAGFDCYYYSSSGALLLTCCTDQASMMKALGT